MIRSINWIFSINPGRAGSNYLFQLFRHAEGCAAFHEAEPICNGMAMRLFLEGRPEPMRALAEEKVERTLSYERRYAVYAETNHCFIKGFGWFIPRFLPQERIAVVVLKRNNPRIVKSLVRVGSLPTMPGGRSWTMLRTVRNPIVPPPRAGLVGARATYRALWLSGLAFRGERYYRRLGIRPLRMPRWYLAYNVKCLRWYVRETWDRVALCRKTFPRVHNYEVDVDDLNDIDGVRELFRFLGLRARDTIQRLIGRPTNLKRDLSVNYGS